MINKQLPERTTAVNAAPSAAGRKGAKPTKNEMAASERLYLQGLESQLWRASIPAVPL